MIQKIGTIALLVDDYDKAIDYYTTKLGFALVENTDLGNGNRWVRIAPQENAETSIVLSKAKDEQELKMIGRQGAGRVLLFLHTSNFEASHKLFVENGVEIIQEPVKHPYGEVLVFKDLYGNLWDLICPA